MSKKKILSGIRATGQLHLGNYLGMVKGMLVLQEKNEYELLFMVADIHATTTPFDPKQLAQSRREVVIDYLAAGLDPQKSIVFLQADVHQHAELAYYLSSVISVARMQHLPTFKEKVKQYPENSNMALLNYPILMASDILLYKSELVPTGIDQEPHLEIAREIARKMNSQFGTNFPEPKRFSTKGEYVPSLSGVGKMSKSVEGSYINLTDDLATIQKKLAKVPTDSGQGSLIDLQNAHGVQALFELTRLFIGEDRVKEFETQYLNSGIQYATLKEELANAISKELQPIQDRRLELVTNTEYVDQVIAEGAAKASLIADQTMQEVKKKMGLASLSMPAKKPTISFEDFMKLDVRIGTVKEATIPKGSNKLIRQVVDFGPDIGERIIFSGIKEWYNPEDLIDRQLPYLINLAPRKMMGEESQGMLMAAAPEVDGQHAAVLFALDGRVEEGTGVI